MLGIFLAIWFVRLVKKGKKLRNSKCDNIDDTTDLIDPQLFQLAKNYLEANLENDISKYNQQKEILKNYLDSEHKRMKDGLTYNCIYTSIITYFRTADYSFFILSGKI